MAEHRYNPRAAEQAILQRISNLPTDFANIADDAGMETYADILKDVKSALKDAEDAKRGAVMPLKAKVAAVTEWFDDNLVAPLRRRELALKQAIGDYQAAVRAAAERARQEAAREAERERQRLAKAAAKAEAEGRERAAEKLEQRAQQVVEEYVPPPEAPSGISTREVWRFEVTDPAQVPREYMSVDERKIGAVVRALKNQAGIPGVRVWCEQVVVARADR